jgi:myo-inositol-1(or 4)-monophosphatase
MSIYQEFLDHAIHLARQAGAFALGAQRGALTIESKTNEFDLVTHVDRHNEDLIRDGVANAFPDHAFLGEEGGGGTDAADVRWIVDPIDGTLNYAHGLPIWCVSIGIEVAGVMEAGVIFDPSRDELFAVLRGEGAHRNGERIAVSPMLDPARSMYVTGFPYDISLDPHGDIPRFERFLRRGLIVRRLGSAALDLAYVACGRFDAFFEGGLSAWDTAAGALMVREAGGTTTHYDGTAYSVYKKSIIASNTVQHGFLEEMGRGETFRM